MTEPQHTVFTPPTKHSIEGMKVRCGRYFGTIKNGRCSECDSVIYVVRVEG